MYFQCRYQIIIYLNKDSFDVISVYNYTMFIVAFHVSIIASVDKDDKNLAVTDMKYLSGWRSDLITILFSRLQMSNWRCFWKAMIFSCAWFSLSCNSFTWRRNWVMFVLHARTFLWIWINSNYGLLNALKYYYIMIHISHICYL